ncbi:MAG: hypothetical protein MJZ25_04790, partial [Fibrobacter sp.]|nr:hypothetical protein [Fibrobacter sp.]
RESAHSPSEHYSPNGKALKRRRSTIPKVGLQIPVELQGQVYLDPKCYELPESVAIWLCDFDLPDRAKGRTIEGAALVFYCNHAYFQVRFLICFPS